MKNRRSGNRLLDAMPHQPLAGPTLFGRADSAQSGHQRMLHALERKKSRRAAFRIPRTTTIAVALLSVIAAAGIMYSYAFNAPTSTPTPTQLVSATPAQAALAPKVEPVAAQIETESEAPAASPFAKLNEPPAELPPAPPPAAATAAKPQTPPASMKAQTPSTSVKSQTPPAAPKAQARPAAPVKVARAAPPAAVRPPAAKESVVKKAKDADVALLQALVKHVDAQQAKAAADAPAPRSSTEASGHNTASSSEEAKKPCVGEGCRAKTCGEDDPSCALAERAQAAQTPAKSN